MSRTLRAVDMAASFRLGSGFGLLRGRLLFEARRGLIGCACVGVRIGLRFCLGRSIHGGCSGGSGGRSRDDLRGNVGCRLGGGCDVAGRRDGRVAAGSGCWIQGLRCRRAARVARLRRCGGCGSIGSLGFCGVGCMRGRRFVHGRLGARYGSLCSCRRHGCGFSQSRGGSRGGLLDARCGCGCGAAHTACRRFCGASHVARRRRRALLKRFGASSLRTGSSLRLRTCR